MPQPKQVKKFIFSLIAISCVMVAWLWLTRSPSVEVIPTNPVPSVSLPAPTVSTPAPTINPVSAGNPAVLATPPTAATPPRFLGRPFARRHGVPPVIEDRWATAATLREVGIPVQADPDYRRRVRLVRTDFKYPLVRLEETLYLDPQSAAEVLVEQTAMVADHVLVKLAPGVDVQTLATLVTAKGGTIRSVKPAAKVYLITISAPLDFDGLPAVIDVLKAASGVITIAEPDFIVHATTTPNDASFAQLWGMHNTGQTGGGADADIDAPEAWGLATGSRSVRVGVIDTGIDYNHPDLSANMWSNPGEIPGNGVDDDGNGYVDDVRGWDFVNNDADPMDDQYHGTHCAGTIGGVNWQVSLVALKFLSASGSGALSDAVEAVAYANVLNLDLTSNSWGGGGFSQALYDVIAAANTAGHLFVAAAGNEASNTDISVNYPSCYDLPNVISVAATDHADQLAYFSNYGLTSVDLAAPGVNIVSTSPGNAYRTLSGTSMATPHVAGAAALLLSRQPGLAAPELKAALLNSVDLVPALSGRVLTQGRLNVASALSALSGLGVSPATGWSATAQIGSILAPASTTFTLRNNSATSLAWTAASNVTWASISQSAGNLASGSSASVTVTLNATAASLLPLGAYEGVIAFTNTADGTILRRLVHLTLDPLTVTVFEENFEVASLDPARWTVTGSANSRAVVTTQNLPHGGTRHLVMDALTDGIYERNEVTLRLNLAGSSDLRLTFWAKGFNEDPNGPPSSPFIDGADFDGVAISADGVTWYEVQPLRSLSADWQKYTVDLDAALAAHGLTYNSDFRIRFNQYDNYTAPTDGIAIDDVLLARIINKRLALVAPTLLTEGGSGTATLTASPAPDTELVVHLSDASSTLVLPATVTLAASQTSIDFSVSAPDDTLRNGTRSPVITATATGWGTAQTVTPVLDNETAVLGLVLPASATEGSTALTGTVTVTLTPDTDVVVALSCDDTGELQVPASVVIPAGQSSATFEFLVVDDNRIDGSTTPTVTARVDNWTSASASITVNDNEVRILTITAPASVREGAASFTATVTLSGTVPTPLTVALASNDTSELLPPAEVVIPAGQLSATVSIAIVDDTLSDGPQTVRLIASTATFTGGICDIIVHDNELHHFGFSIIPDGRSTSVPFALTITAYSEDGVAITGYTGPAALSAQAANGDIVAFSPMVTGTFANGAWTGSLTATTSGTGVQITATDGAVFGQSNTFNILGAPKILVSPSSIAVGLHRDESTTREVVISNSGQLPLTWSVSGINTSNAESLPEVFAGPVFTGGPERPKDNDAASDASVYEAPRVDSNPAITAPWAPRLETVLATLDTGQSTLRALIPGRYAFTEGVTGTNISDGGNDMYDGGNYLGTDLGVAIAYSDGVILSSNALGASGGRYFTRKYDGLFVFAADLAGVSYFEITGNLGADGSGSTDTAILTQTRGGVTYRGFVKRVYGAGDPSVNHLVIVADNGSITHSASTDTNNDLHRVSGLTGVTRIYHLLYAGTSGAYIDNTSTQAVMTAFLDIVSTGDWMSAAPTSGTVAPGASASVTLTFDSTALEFRTYTQTLRISSNDPFQPTSDVPVSLTVTDRVLHHFEFAPIPAQPRGAPFTVRLSALAADGNPVVSFASPVALAANGVTLTPSTTTAAGWANGVWTGQVTATTFGTGVTLTANDGTGHTGLSNAFDVGTGPFTRFAWDTIPSAQVIDTPFPVLLRAVDAGGNPVPAYSGTAALAALVPLTLAPTGTASSTDNYPFAAPYGAVVRQEVLYPASALGAVPRRLTSIALNVTSTSPTASFSQWTIRLKTSTRTTLSGASFDNDGWTTVHVSNATPSVAGWTTFVFSTPFDYDGTSALLVDFSFRNSSTIYNYIYTSVSYDSAIRSIRQTSPSATTDPFAFTTATGSGYVPNVRFTSLEPIPLRPASANVVNGVWTGAVSLAATANPAQLRAVSTSPASASDSNTFTVFPAPVPAPSFPFVETWEAGTFAPAWTLTGTGTYRSQITTAYTPHGGTSHLVLDSSSYGTYARNEATLTLDLAGRTGVVLNFWAKGFNESANAPATNPFTGGADFDGVAISTDGVTWYEVQSLRTPALTNSWQQFTVNLDPVLASRGLSYTSSFRIRFNRYGYEYVTYGGIAIDDIAITTSATGVTTLTLPTAAAESAPPLSGTLSLAVALPTDTVFLLSSSAPAKLSLSATVTLPAGQTNVAFFATPINDTLFDGSRTIIVTATPPVGCGLFLGTTTLILTDDDTPALALSVSPSTLAENASSPATATLTLGAPAAARLTVALTSSDPTAATVPATVVIDAGQSSATFLVTPVNDTKIDGPQTTTISATLLGASPATTSITVTDDENTTLQIGAPYSITEGSTGTLTVYLSGTLATPLTLSLASSNPAQLTVPTSVTIPAGSTSANFTATSVDDTDTDGSARVVVTVTAPGFTTATASITAQDNDLHHFAVTASVSSPQLANRTFTTTAYARTIDDYTATFNGTAYLSANSGATVLPSTPASITFSSGYWSGPVSVNTPATGVTLRLDDGAGHTGVSSVFDVTIGALDHFAFASIASPQSATMPVPLTITAQDVANNTVTSFAGTATLSATLPSRLIGTGTTNYGFPFGGYQSRTQSIYPASELGGAGQLSGLALDIIGAPGSAAANFTIRVKSTALSSYSTNVWESTGWTTVYQGSPTIGTTGWFQFNFTSPFDYDGTSNLMVDISYNSTFYVSGSSRGTTTSATRSLWINTSGQADPLTWSGSTPNPGSSPGVPNLRLNIRHPAVLTPSITGTFVNGVWSGSTTFATVATDVAIQALSGNALGVSNTFTVQPGGIPNLSVTPGNFTATGGRGGPFTPSTRSWTLTNSSSTSLAWFASKSASWLSISPASGTLVGGASTTVTASFAPDALALTLGTYTDSIIFFNQTNGLGSTVRDASLTILPAGDLAVTPAAAFDSSGDQGGPFNPATTTWTLSNLGDATLSWTAAKTAAWLSLDSTGGTLVPGATATVTATLVAAANTLNPGTYTDTVAFTNTTTGRGTTNRAINLTVRLGPPRIITQPVNTTVAPMENAVIELTAATGASLTYQWYRGNSGDTASPISGATGPLLITPSLNATSTFWARVTNYVGTADTVTATVTVQTVALQNLKAFGDNSVGGLGDGTTIARLTPVQAASDVIGITAGHYYTRFLKTDGTLWGVGYNKYGQLGDGSTTDRSIAVQIATGAVQSASGSFHSVFVKADGTFWGSGNNGNGELGDGSYNQRLTPIQIATGVVQASAGANHTMFIKTDGTLWATGYNSYSQLGDGTSRSRLTPVQVATGVAQVSAGWYQTLFVKTDGTLWGMGENASGQLGDGTTTRRTTPVQIATGVRQVSTRVGHTLFVKTNGTLWAMGSNSFGQLGDGTTTQRTAPVQIASGVSYVSAANNHTLFVKTDGTLWAMGHNGRGQLGDGSTTTRYTPVQVGSAITIISAGNDYSLFLSKKPGIITQTTSMSSLAGQTITLSVIASGPPPLTYQWYVGTSGNTSMPIPGATGTTFTTPAVVNTTDYWVRISNAYGSTDSNTLTATVCSSPIITTPPANLKVTSGTSAVMSVSATGGSLAYQWYRGHSGDTASPIVGATNPIVITQPLDTTTSFWVRITNIAGTTDSSSTIAIVQPLLHLNLRAMGANSYGQLGDGSITSRSTPVQITSDVTQVAGGSNHSLFIKTDGTLWTMGYNSYGQLGDGTTTQRPDPAQIATAVAQVSAGWNHSLFIKNDRTLWAMGYNYAGQLGDGSSTSRSTPVQVAADVAQASAGNAHSLFVKTDGTLWSTGLNASGQLGIGSTSSRVTPTQIATGVAQTSAGWDHSLFLKTDGTLWAMGYNFAGQIGDASLFNRLTPVQVASGVVQISAGSHFSLFLKADGTLWGMGDNIGGPLGDGTTNSRATPIQITSGVSRVAAGGYHTFFIKTDSSLWAIGGNSAGQLGDGTATNRYYPIRIALGVTDVSLGDYYSFFLQSPPPVIVTPPLSQGVPQGQRATLTVAADSPLTVTYQWYQGVSGETSQPIAGATSAAFTVPPVVSPASYWVRATNIIGSTDSSTAVLTLAPPPDTDSDGMPDAWETAHGLDPASSAGSNGSLGDPDHDAQPNFLEYAFGLDPQQAEITPPYSVQTATDPTTGQAELRFTYRRLLSPGVLTYSLLTSTDLKTWIKPVPQPAELSATPNPDNTTATVVARLPLVGPRLFVRIQIESP